MKNKTKSIVVSVLLIGNINLAIAAECKSAEDIHREKMEKYEMPELPSLLSDCGIGGILGGWLDLGSLNIDLDNLFCGYGANDVGNFYGGVTGTEVNLPDAIELDGQIGSDVGWGKNGDGGIIDYDIETPTVDLIGGANSVTNIEVESVDFDDLFQSNIKEDVDEDNN